MVTIKVFRKTINIGKSKEQKARDITAGLTTKPTGSPTFERKGTQTRVIQGGGTESQRAGVSYASTSRSGGGGGGHKSKVDMNKVTAQVQESVYSKLPGSAPKTTTRGDLSNQSRQERRTARQELYNQRYYQLKNMGYSDINAKTQAWIDSRFKKEELQGQTTEQIYGKYSPYVIANKALDAGAEAIMRAGEYGGERFAKTKVAQNINKNLYFIDTTKTYSRDEAKKGIKATLGLGFFAPLMPTTTQVVESLPKPTGVALKGVQQTQENNLIFTKGRFTTTSGETGKVAGVSRVATGEGGKTASLTYAKGQTQGRYSYDIITGKFYPTKTGTFSGAEVSVSQPAKVFGGQEGFQSGIFGRVARSGQKPTNFAGIGAGVEQQGVIKGASALTSKQGDVLTILNIRNIPKPSSSSFVFGSGSSATTGAGTGTSIISKQALSSVGNIAGASTIKEMVTPVGKSAVAGLSFVGTLISPKQQTATQEKVQPTTAVLPRVIDYQPPKEETRIFSGSRAITSTRETPAVKEQEIVIPKEKEKEKTTQPPVQRQVTPNINRYMFVAKPGTPYKEPLLPFSSYGKPKTLMQFKPEKYSVFTKALGKDVKIGTFSSLKGAKQKLVSEIFGTLRASGYITKGEKKVQAKELDLFGNYFIPSKSNPFSIVEKREKRLKKGTREISEIQYFKKTKSKKKARTKTKKKKSPFFDLW